MTAIHLNPVAVSSVALLRAIRAGNWNTKTELAEAAGRDRRNIARDLTILSNAGLIEERAESDCGKPVVLTDDGDAQLDAIERAESGEGKPGSPAIPAEILRTGVLFLRHEHIVPDPDNAREDWDSEAAQADLRILAEDIADRDLLQGLIVRLNDGPDGPDAFGFEPQPGDYMLVGGERRWRAIGLLIADGRWAPDRLIPAKLKESDDALALRLAALSENLQRRKLNPLEKAKAFEALATILTERGVEESKVNREIADRLGVTIEHVQQHRSFMRLDETDQARLTLPEGDPHRLSTSDARRRISDLNKAEAAREEADAVPVQERLALAEVLHAVAALGHHTYADIPVRAGAAETKEGQALAAMGWLRFAGPVEHGDDSVLGHYVVARGHSAPKSLGDPFWSPREHERDEALRKVQTEAGHPDRADYVTEWLNGPIELTDEGRAVIAEAQARRERLASDEARRVAEREAAEAAKLEAMERQRAVAARSRDLFAAHRSTPAPAKAVVELADAADAKLPWRMKHNGDVVAADGELIIGGRTNDRAEARMRLLILAVNTAGGFETPEDEPDPNPVLDEETFVRRMADALTVHSYQTPDDETFVDAAARFLAEFLSDNGVAFGGDGWDWTAVGAEHLAVEAMTAEAREAEEGEEAEQAYAAADHEGQD